MFWSKHGVDGSAVVMNLLTDLKTKISNLELEIEKFRSQLISLRGLVNRKLGEDAGIEKKEKSLSPDGLDDLRT